LKRLRFALCCLFLCRAAAPAVLCAAEISDGSIRLKLHEQTGGFSLYYLERGEAAYTPFFADKDPRTSFLALKVDGRVYRLGETPDFHVTSESGGGNAALRYDSTFLSVREEFTFIQTAGAAESNGVQLTVRIKNTGQVATAVGVRLLLDTSLGEEPGKPPFIIDRQRIGAEQMVAGSAGRFWVSRNERLSLAGSIASPVGAAPVGAMPGGGAPVGAAPALVHFANWKRLNDAAWQPEYIEGRNFSYPPASIGDSAVCYYYDPVTLAPQEEQSYTIILAAAEPEGDTPAPAVSAGRKAAGFAAAHDRDIALLRGLITRLEQFLAGDSVIGEEDLSGMEQAAADIQERYGLP
jgi:hypothetical protein